MVGVLIIDEANFTRSKARGAQHQRDHSLEGVWCTEPGGPLARRRVVHITRGTTRSKACGAQNPKTHSSGMWYVVGGRCFLSFMQPTSLARRRVVHRTRGTTRSKACGAQTPKTHSSGRCYVASQASQGIREKNMDGQNIRNRFSKKPRAKCSF